MRLVILQGSHPRPDQYNEYQSAYSMWQLVWSETFRELDGVEKVYSDDFTRQDEILCIFRKNICLALGVMRWVDHNLVTSRGDSYFKMWPEGALEGLGANGPNIIICSNLTVHPLARGGKLGLSMKDLIAGLLIERLLESGADAMTGTMRADRGMHKTTYQFGASLLAANLTHHHVPVDLVAFFPQKMVTSKDPLLAEAITYLWSTRRQVIGRRAA